MNKLKRFLTVASLLIPIAMPTIPSVGAVSSFEEAWETRDSTLEVTETEALANSDEILEEIAATLQEDNDSMLAGSAYTTFEIYTGAETSLADMDIEFLYDDNQLLNSAIGRFKDSDGETTSMTQSLVFSKAYDPNTMYIQNSEEGPWEAQEVPDPDDFSMDPDYFALVTGVEAILAGAVSGDYDVDIYETDESYILHTTDPNVSITDIFGEQYSISFEGITEDDLDKQVLLAIDKETNYINAIFLDMTGILSMHVQTILEDHNEFDEDHFTSFLNDLE